MIILIFSRMILR